MPKVIVKINGDGSGVTYNVEGAEGQGCTELTENAIAALAAGPKEAEHKPEYYVASDEQENTTTT